jgi:hypothetical protein
MRTAKQTLTAASVGLVFLIGTIPLAEAVLISIDDRTEGPFIERCDSPESCNVFPLGESFSFDTSNNDCAGDIHWRKRPIHNT